MKVIPKEDIDEKKIIEDIKKGKLFIYPTDTIYGIGCNALIEDSVEKVRALKRRPDKPFSVIAPDKRWIKENCILVEEYLDKLPGPFTFVCKLKNKPVAESVNPGKDTLGVRIPGNWFSGLVKKANVPFVTTSVNIAGESYMTSLEDAEESIKKGVDYIIYEGPKDGRPSTIIDFTKEKIEVIER